MNKDSEKHHTFDGPSMDQVKNTGRSLLAGLAALVPFIGTIWLLVIVYRIMLKAGDLMILGVMKFVSLLIGQPKAYETWHVDFYGSNLLRFLLPIILTALVGIAVLNKPGKRVLHWMNELVQKIPVIGFIYSALVQFVDAVRGLGDDRKFKSVVYIEYPSPGCRLIGFVTGNFHDEQKGNDVTSVFIPTSPNPMTGFMLIVDDDKVIPCDMSIERATKMILSAGLVTPDHLGDAVRVNDAPPPKVEEGAPEKEDTSSGA
ncbi:hypothetical protein Rhal01_01644 [Rubritalea halochordaticola]|uniref:DUF502 domain-containing protein n=1 Tax=Rubritalea halochordaticola TaxID=714537 RepID=A0ABP9V1J1_9BACT